MICRYLYETFTLYGPTFQTVPIPQPTLIAVLQPPQCRNITGLGSCPFARRYSGNRCFFLLLLLLRCFSSEGSPPSPGDKLMLAGLSHSDIRGSLLVCKSPRLFAAFHVLLRLQEPRHPPYALFLLYFYLFRNLFEITHTSCYVSLTYLYSNLSACTTSQSSTHNTNLILSLNSCQ